MNPVHVNNIASFEENNKNLIEQKQRADPLYLCLIEYLVDGKEFHPKENDFGFPAIFKHLKANLGRYHMLENGLYYRSEEGVSLLCVPGEM